MKGCGAAVHKDIQKAQREKDHSQLRRHLQSFEEGCGGHLGILVNLVDLVDDLVYCVDRWPLIRF